MPDRRDGHTPCLGRRQHPGLGDARNSRGPCLPGSHGHLCQHRIAASHSSLPTRFTTSKAAGKCRHRSGECCSHRAGGSQPMSRLPSWFSICNSAWAASPITRNRSLAMCISQQTLGLCSVPLPVGAGRFTGSRCTREPKFSPSASRLGRGLGALIAPMKVLLLTSGCFMPRYLS